MPIEHNWHEQRLLEDLSASTTKKEIEIIYDISAFTLRLTKMYPIQMDKIDWNSIPGMQSLSAPHGRSNTNYQLIEPATELRQFWSALLRENDIADNTSVIVVGDSLISFALRMTVATLTQHLVEILSIPHHTYVFPDDISWCFGYTAEDEAFFARSRQHQ